MLARWQLTINIKVGLIVLLTLLSGSLALSVVRASTAEQLPLLGPLASQSQTQILAAGDDHTCALTTNGGVKCWGFNYFGQLGDGTTSEQHTPVDVVGLTSSISSIALGISHSCALTSLGAVKCWGNNSYGQLGDGTYITRTVPVDVVGLSSNVISIGAGGIHTCAINASGGVKCWGRNNLGQLGDGTTIDRQTPVDVVGLNSGVSAIAAEQGHTCALTTNGGVKCWGFNNFGQLGDGTIVLSRTTPVDVVGLSSGVTSIAAGAYHTCALTTNGGVKCWGFNDSGQLGDGTSGNGRTTPGDVVGLGSGVNVLAAWFKHSCAAIGGGMKCWGENQYGELGDGTTVFSRTTPVDVVGLSSGVTSIAAGGYHTCALTSGGVKCWGLNNYGQLGDGTTTQRLIPVDVVGPWGGLNCYTLAITSNPSSGGSITTDKLRDCNGGAGYTAGISVTLTATPAQGYQFTSWSGDASGTSEIEIVVMNGSKSVTANFSAPHVIYLPMIQR